MRFDALRKEAIEYHCQLVMDGKNVRKLRLDLLGTLDKLDRIYLVDSDLSLQIRIQVVLDYGSSNLPSIVEEFQFISKESVLVVHYQEPPRIIANDYPWRKLTLDRQRLLTFVQRMKNLNMAKNILSVLKFVDQWRNGELDTLPPSDTQFPAA